MSNSNSKPPQTQCCTEQSAAASSLADLLHEVPLVMQLMESDCWSAVSACSRQLRQLVQSRTKIVYAHDAADIDLLIKYKRPELRLICLGYHNVGYVESVLWPENDAVELEAIINVFDSQFQAQVVMVKPTSHQHGDQPACHSGQLHQWIHRGEWKRVQVTGTQQNSTGAAEMAQLTALALQHIEQLQVYVWKLGKAATTHLITGEWCHLDKLKLSYNNMDAASLQLLARGSWCHLTHLNLSGNKLNEEALSHICAADWSLKKMILTGTSLTPSGVAVLASKSPERLRTLDLADNLLDEVAVQQLVQGKWLKLRSLYLSDNNISDAGMGHLVKGKWPCLKNLSVERNCVTLSGLLCLPTAQWPCTESLVITTKQQGVAAQSELLQDRNTSVSIQFDTDLIVFTADKHTTEYMSFNVCTSKYKSNVLKAKARHVR